MFFNTSSALSRYGLGLMALFVWAMVPGIASSADQVGIYFDDQYQVSSLDVTEFPSTVIGHLVLMEPSAPEGVAGWELCVDIEGPGTLLGWQLQGQALNVLSPPCFVVGIGDPPLPGNDAVLLATFELLVEAGTPITLAVEPVQLPSIPDEMAYLSAADPGVIIAMGSVTGFPDVAWINQFVPVAIVDPPVLPFGEVPVGGYDVRNVEVSNPGGGTLYLNVTLAEPCEAFTLTGVSGQVAVPPDESVHITVRFDPTAVEFYECTLDLGTEYADPVPISGYGREPIVDFSVIGDPDFGEVVIGTTRARTLSILNTGEVPFVLDPSLVGECPEFEVLNPGPQEIFPAELGSIDLTFTPGEVGTVSCSLDLGALLGVIELSGSGREAVLEFNVVPEVLEFPDLVAGTSTSRTVLITNTGEIPLDLNVVLVSDEPPFSILNGAGLHTLQTNENHSVVVRFFPESVGEFSNSLSWGHPAIAEVPVSGAGVEANVSCVVTPESLDFGTVPMGQSALRYLSVRNNGNVPFTVTPSGDCGNLMVSPPSATVPAGHTQDFSVRLFPQVLGPWECLISMGESNCAPVPCSGYVVESPSPDENQVGIYFDDDYTIYEAYVDSPGTMLPAHLVLKYPSDPHGIAAWECRMEIIGGLTFLVGTDFAGEAINVTAPPEYIVGLGTPLPSADAVRLATFNLLVLDINTETFLELHPVSTPSIPGEMAWLTGGDDPMIIPMLPASGDPLVAVINFNPLAVQAPAPEVVMNGHQVELSWDVNAGNQDGYIVYRRGETGTAEALFDQPLDAPEGRFTYRDNPLGFAAGTTLNYSYAVMHNGVEKARSPETEIILSGMPMARTRLLPNVPNPFNPQTEIHFEMETAGLVRVSIYDVSGRLVTRLVDESLSAGPHSKVWQGKDLSGRQVPSGAYYLRLESQGQSDHRKIMLLK